MYLYDNLDEEDKNLIIKLIEESEGENNMLNVRRILDAEVIETINQIIQKMIKMNFEDDVIKQATRAKKSKIEKIRKEMQARI